jgi:hypothetical protein
MDHMTAPSAVLATWFPASVVLPGQADKPWNQVKVYATPEGLAIYRRSPPPGGAPDWFSPIDFAATPRPPVGYAARNGAPIKTEAGLVVITTSGACGCGSTLKRFTPDYANTIQSWPQAATP